MRDSTSTTSRPNSRAVIRHTAQIASGSSGGPLLSDALTLVGINFAGEKGDGFHNGYAIPLSKIKEFLEKYVYS